MFHLRAASQQYTHGLCLGFSTSEHLIFGDKRYRRRAIPGRITLCCSMHDVARFILVDCPWIST